MPTYNKKHKYFITQDPFCLRMLDNLRDIAMSDAPVIITGETGTGKGLLANAIHQLGPRANRPFMTLDCGMKEPILEMALLDYGTIVDSKFLTSKDGLVELSNRGTLFLNDINSISVEFHKWLSQFLETYTYHSPKSQKQLKANVRIITSANPDIKNPIENAKLNKDLYHKLSKFELHIPPLRDRPKDIPLLAEYFAEKFRLKYAKPNTVLSKEVIQYLIHHPLSGNARELHNLIERGIVISKDSGINMDDILGTHPPEINLA